MNKISSTQYGYGHTKEAAALVRADLNALLVNEKKMFNLKISVTKADSSYGGPRVKITTTDITLDKSYEYIVDENGEPADSGKLISKHVSEFTYGRPYYQARIVTPPRLEKLNATINEMLSHYGHDEDDAMTDYFNNTAPLFYGVEYERGNK